MKIIVTGASGLVGTALVPYLRGQGHAVARLVRSREVAYDAIYWDPNEGELNPDDLDGFDTVIHLAGANVAEGRWTEKRKRLILESRVNGLRTLTEAIRGCSEKPTTLISASATGFYGDRGDEVLDESSEAGAGFLAEICREWEGGLREIETLGLRRVSLRLGIVLSRNGGALGKMLPAFKCGVGGRLGSGKQWMSWISETDLMRAIHHVIADGTIHGPVNVVSPEPVTNAEFTITLGRVMSRPTVLPVPAFVLRLLFGQMADEALLASSRVNPRVLQASAFGFTHKRLERALQSVLS